MSNFLDLQTSQNASFAGSIAVPITSVNTPQLFARLTVNLSNATTTAHVAFTGSIGLQVPIAPAVTSATVMVVRGTSTSDLIVYSVTTDFQLSILGPQTLSFSGADASVPIPASGFQTYSAYVQVNVGGVTRVGPENLNAIATSP